MDRLGTVTVDTPVETPAVQLDGDLEGFATRNGLPGYTPSVGDRVWVRILNNRRQQITGKQR